MDKHCLMQKCHKTGQTFNQNDKSIMQLFVITCNVCGFEFTTFTQSHSCRSGL